MPLVNVKRASTLLFAAALAAPTLLVACSSESDSASGSQQTDISVDSSDNACTLSLTTAPAGKLKFEVKNSGGKTTEFYLYAADGKKIVSEVEGIGPSISKKMTASVKPGTYVTACKPGEVGDGIRAEFVVTEASATPAS